LTAELTPSTQVPNSFESGNGSFNDCVIVGANVTVPWDNPHDVISLHTIMLVENVKALAFIPLLFIIGFTTNVLNAMVFARQGLSERINMCLFILSLNDLAYVSYMTAFNAEDVFLRLTRRDSLTVYLDYRPVYSYFLNRNIVGLYGL
jgi:hypothetical protein